MELAESAAPEANIQTTIYQHPAHPKERKIINQDDDGKTRFNHSADFSLFNA